MPPDRGRLTRHVSGAIPSDAESTRWKVEAVGGLSSSASRKGRGLRGWTPTPRRGIRTLPIPDVAITGPWQPGPARDLYCRRLRRRRRPIASADGQQIRLAASTVRRTAARPPGPAAVTGRNQALEREPICMRSSGQGRPRMWRAGMSFLRGSAASWPRLAQLAKKGRSSWATRAGSPLLSGARWPQSSSSIRCARGRTLARASREVLR